MYHVGRKTSAAKWHLFFHDMVTKKSRGAKRRILRSRMISEYGNEKIIRCEAPLLRSRKALRKHETSQKRQQNYISDSGFDHSVGPDYDSFYRNDFRAGNLDRQAIGNLMGDHPHVCVGSNSGRPERISHDPEDIRTGAAGERAGIIR